MSTDEVASRLSGKLLQGWCMLDKSCETCNTPIMRDKEKKEYCCGCQIFLGTPQANISPSLPTNKPQGSQKYEPLGYVQDIHSEGEKTNRKSEEEKYEKGSKILTQTQHKFQLCADKFLDRLLASSDLSECGNLVSIIHKLSESFKNFS